MAVAQQGETVLALELGTPMIFPAAIPLDRHPAAVYVGGLLEGRSQETTRSALDGLARLIGYSDRLDCPWWMLRYQHVMRIRSMLASRYAATTANKMLALLKGVLKEAWRLGYMSAEEYQRAIDFKRVTGATKPQAAGRALDAEELAALFRAAAEDKDRERGARDAALLAVGYGAGLRRAEIIGLDLVDVALSRVDEAWLAEKGLDKVAPAEVDWERVRFVAMEWDAVKGLDEAGLDLRRVRCGLTVRGKGNKMRWPPLAPTAIPALVRWLQIRGTEEGPLFLGVWRGGRVKGERMGYGSLGGSFKRLAERAKVKGFSVHDLRRSYISDLLDQDVDSAVVADLVGHSSVDTTRGYNRRRQRLQQKAVVRLSVPYSVGK